LYYYKKIEEEV